jgi:hypothetical protein
MSKTHLYLVLLLLFLVACTGPEKQGELSLNSHVNNYRTYCNPIDIDYSYMSHYRARFDEF